MKKWADNCGLVISTSVNNQTVRPITPFECREHILNKNVHKRIILILGSEGYGVSPHLARNSDISICINRTGLSRYPY